MKFTVPKIEEIPAKCKLNMAKSTEAEGCPNIPANGGYTVQPVPAPVSTILDKTNSSNAGGKSQKLMLFKRGKAMSGAPIRIGTNQLPKPPI